MRAVFILATKELNDGLRNRWILSIFLLLGSLALLLLLVSSAPGGTVKVSSLNIGVVNLTSLTVYLLPLIALMLSFDALVGEFERGTMLLLLTYPLARWQIVMGKFVGHLVILMAALLLGYGGAAVISLLIADGSSAGWENYLAMMVSSLLLGAVFLVIGYLVSLLARERSAAIGLAIGVWLFFVVLYDLGLLGVLLVDKEQLISQELFSFLMLINPTDLYRVFNLSALSGNGEISHIAGAIEIGSLSPLMLISACMGWLLIPFLAVIGLFQRREV